MLVKLAVNLLDNSIFCLSEKWVSMAACNVQHEVHNKGLWFPSRAHQRLWSVTHQEPLLLENFHDNFQGLTCPILFLSSPVFLPGSYQ